MVRAVDISILICSTWATWIRAPPRRRLVEAPIVHLYFAYRLPGLNPSAHLGEVFRFLARLASASLTLATATESWPCKSRSSILKSGSPVFTRSPHFTSIAETMPELRRARFNIFGAGLDHACTRHIKSNGALAGWATGGTTDGVWLP